MGSPLQLATIFITMMTVFTEINTYSIMAHECRSANECGSDECCVLGMMRYSTAQCMPLAKVNEYCREENAPENKTLYYPGGITMDVMNIYLHVCPCETGLICESNTCTPQEDTSYENNYLY